MGRLIPFLANNYPPHLEDIPSPVEGEARTGADLGRQQEGRPANPLRFVLLNPSASFCHKTCWIYKHWEAFGNLQVKLRICIISGMQTEADVFSHVIDTISAKPWK